MRIDHLELVRFGKFTDRAVPLPRADNDFHVLVGPNEAGKSTIRAAVLDLLFGIPRLSPHTFKHQSDLCIGARVDHLGRLIEFRRVKGNKKTLRDLQDNPLADDVLLPFLGNINREYFSQMFGLDHHQLVKGSSSILKASDDLGSILFQSAVGVDSLGKVREALETEADKLWAPRKSADRAYYVAAEELERATSALKQVMVRGKDWSEAHSKVAELEAAHAAAKNAHAELRKRQRQLDRIRRCSQHLSTLSSAEAQLQGLGDVPVLPETAGKSWLDAERALALAAADIKRFQQQQDEAQASLNALALDDQVRKFATEVTELNEQRLQFRAHPGDIKSRQAEVDAHWTIAKGHAERLGWNVSGEAEVKSQLPSPVARSELSRLAQEHPGLKQAFDSAKANEAAKQDDLKAASDGLADLVAVDASLELQTALQRAQKLGDFEGTERAQRRLQQRRLEELQSAEKGLGTWQKDFETLQEMHLPPVESVRALVSEQAADELRMKAAAATVRNVQAQIAKLRLEASQFEKAHALVSLEDLQGARQIRDATWQKVREGAATPHGATADAFERELRTADALADRRHATVQHSSEWQVKLAQVERLELELKTANSEVDGLEAASAERKALWAELSDQADLNGLDVQAAEQWFEARRRVLEAATAAKDASETYALHLEAIRAAEAELRAELLKVKQLDVETVGLAALMSHAQAYLSLAADAQGQRKTLEKQAAEAKRQLEPLARAVEKTQTDLADWEARWARALLTAGLQADSSLAQVKSVLDVAMSIDEALVEMASTRTKRIDAMQADLAKHAEAAQRLCSTLAPELADSPPEAIALKLSERLKTANETHQEASRLEAVVRDAEAKLAAAQGSLGRTQAEIQPLLARAKVAEHEALQHAIDQSDRWRELTGAKDAAENALQEQGDGLTVDQLRAEASDQDLQALASEIAELGVKDQDLVNQLSNLSASLQAAHSVLNAIAGAADAARAEAQRQEALSKMTDAVERYLKVYAGARLLRWSIDKYRETKQGPMLQTASRIFAALTLKSFERLTVDYDSDEPRLVGRRSDGSSPVDIDGMSEGVRDQLYLALRLAALETHLSEAQAMPFIADDLFVNFDDARSKAGFEALRHLSKSTQVLFLTHHDHLLPSIQEVFGPAVNIVRL